MTQNDESDHTLATESNRFVVIVYQAGVREKDSTAILSRPLFYLLQQQIEQKINTPKAATIVDVWIDSPGGDANVAYKLSLELRERCRQLRVVIPDYAKSAATLFAMGCDSIFMGVSAELGPLDVQIEHPDREGLTVSGLDVARPLSFLGDLAIEYIKNNASDLQDAFGLPRKDILSELRKLSAALFEPVSAKLDPQLIHRATRDLEIAKTYAVAMMASRSPATPQDRGESERCRKLAEQMVRGYPAHEVIIGRGEAKFMGLPVEPAESYDKWTAAKQCWSVHRSNGKFLCGVFSEAEIGQLENESCPQSRGDNNENESESPKAS